MKAFLKKCIMLCAAAALCLLCGCSLAGKKTEQSDTSKISIFYTNADGNELIARPYTVPDNKTFDEIMTDVLSAFRTPDTEKLRSAQPEGVEVNGYMIVVDTVTIDFSAAYLGLTNVQEVILRAALVKTLVQLPGVAHVSVTVDGQPLTEPDRSVIGPMDEDTFIDSQGVGINSARYVELELYFADQEGTGITRERRSDVLYSSNIMMENLIVEEIIKGPGSGRLLPVTSPSVVINSVKTEDDICVVDLDSTFNETYNEKVTPEACLYAFVNSLCEACEVSGVSFRIDGSSQVRFRGQISLDQVFYRESDIISVSDTPVVSSLVGIGTQAAEETQTDQEEE